MPVPDCPTSEELSGWLSSQAAAARMPDFEVHLSRCGTCRRALASLHRQRAPEPPLVTAPDWLKARALEIPATRPPAIARPVSHRGHRLVWISAAAALLLVSASAYRYLAYRYLNDAPTAPQSSDDVLRQDSAISTAPQLLTPSAGAVVTPERIEFRWRRANGAASYLFTLMSDRGDIVVQTPTARESLVLDPTGAPLERGKTYFWYVTARSPDGTTLDSAIGRFTLDPK